MANRGYLILNGGEALTPETRDLDREWLKIVRRGKRPRVLVIPSAAPEKPQKVAYQAVQHYNSLGTFPEYKLLTTPLAANTLTEWEIIDKVEVVVLTDGSAPTLIDRIKDTHTHEALQRLLLRRACLNAIGASAMALGAYYWFGNAWEPGLSVAPHLAILARHEHVRMRFSSERLLDGLPEGITLIGVDEQTSVIWRPDDSYEVLGRGEVTVYRAADRLDAYRAGNIFSLSE